MIRSAMLVSALTLLSRILGYGRDVLLAWVLGAGPIADAFFVALRLPNFFRTLFAEGAFTSAFVPMFSQSLANHDRETARLFASRIFTLMSLVLFFFVLVLEIAMPEVISIMAMGYSAHPSKFHTTMSLAAITTPYLVFISLSSLCAGVMNSVGRFGVAATAPILLNITMIIALMMSMHHAEKAGYHLAYAVTLAGILQFTWLYMHCWQEKLLPTFLDPFGDSHVKAMLKKMVPGIVGAGVMQINILVSTTIASLVPQAVSILSYVDRIVQLPLALIGTALGTALLPTLSRMMRGQNREEAYQTQRQAVDIALIFTLPAMVGCFFLAYPLMSVLFERGAFTPDVTAGCANALVIMAAGLPAFILVKIFTPCFYAVQDTKTPFRIAIICLFLNMGMSVMLIGPLSYLGIAIANVTSSWLNVILLYIVGVKEKLIDVRTACQMRALRIIAAVSVMGGVLYIFQDHFWYDVFDPDFSVKLIAFLMLMASACISYFGSAILFGVFSGYYPSLRKVSSSVPSVS